MLYYFLLFKKLYKRVEMAEYTNYHDIDQDQLQKDIEEIRDNIGAATIEDFNHLLKVERWGRIAAFIGYATAWIPGINIISAFLISTGNVTRWANVAHPVLHGAYDKVPGVPFRYTKKGFAQGHWRRFLDWTDWIYPKAWDMEHNKMHHYHLGEKDDPDNVELNMYWLTESKIPMPLRYVIVLFFTTVWKPAYYAPNTLKILENLKKRKLKLPEQESFLRLDAFNPMTEDGKSLWTKFYLPYFILRFVLLPLPFLLISQEAFFSVLFASVLAEFITNVHSFTVIVPNHSAGDIYRFTEPHKTQGEFYLRQIMGSVNYKTGSDINDFGHGWLNYQIEHHLFPNLPLSQYQKMQPLVKEVCEKHGLEYRQESVFKRAYMTIELMVGKTKNLTVDHI